MTALQSRQRITTSQNVAILFSRLGRVSRSKRKRPRTFPSGAICLSGSCGRSAGGDGDRGGAGGHLQALALGLGQLVGGLLAGRDLAAGDREVAAGIGARQVAADAVGGGVDAGGEFGGLGGVGEVQADQRDRGARLGGMGGLQQAQGGHGGQGHGGDGGQGGHELAHWSCPFG
uniref:Uncharacterized protein n=1 Tax=Caulobacter sp. (strain K31) TaxID=366602 RepID=B0SVI9_CAUSK